MIVTTMLHQKRCVTCHARHASSDSVTFCIRGHTHATSLTAGKMQGWALGTTFVPFMSQLSRAQWQVASEVTKQP